MAQEWLSWTASDLGRAIGQGQIDPLELTNAFLENISQHPEAQRIYATVCEERALSEASAASKRAKSDTRLSALDGVPISWKDLFDTANIVTAAGSRLLENRLPEHDAAVVTIAANAGLVCLGKTHMSELAFSGLGYNPMTETSPCINDPTAVAGGSSSGAAASVAFGMAACGIGSDTGGSVRVPAVWNDLVGLKTTFGNVPTKGVVPLCSAFDTVGPLCRSVEDATAVFAILSSQNAPDLCASGLNGIRCLVLKNDFLNDIEAKPQAAFDSAVGRIQDAGAQVDFASVGSVDKAMPLSACLFTAEAWGTWKNVIEANPDRMFPEILKRFRYGETFAAADYVGSRRKLLQIREEFAAQTAHYHAILVPTAPNMPPNIDRLKSDHAYYVAQNLLALRNTRIANLMGLCAITLPTGIPSCGIMAMAAGGADRRLLRHAAAIEAALA